MHRYLLNTPRSLVALLITVLIWPVLGVTPAAQAAGSGEIDLENLDRLPSNDRLVFNRIESSGLTQHRFVTLRIHNRSATDALTLQRPVFSGPDAARYTIHSGFPGTVPIAIPAAASRDIVVRFGAPTTDADPSNDDTCRCRRDAVMTLRSSDGDEPELQVALVGWNQPGIGGENEATLTELVDLFGYKIDILHPKEGESMQPPPVGDQQRPAAPFTGVGDEVLSTQWARASADAPVYVRQLAAFQGESPPTFRIGSASFRYNTTDWHTIFPTLPVSPTGTPRPPAELTVSPSGNFSISVSGYSTSASTTNHALRMWPLRDRNGVLVPNTYILGQDYVSVGASSTNYDYQDNVYLITNIRPADYAQDPNPQALVPGSSKLVLDFDKTLDGTLKSTGFIDTQRNKIDDNTVENQRVGSPGASYDASKVTLNTGGQGTLTLESGAGINTNNENTHVNNLCLPFDGRNGAFTISTRILGPLPFNQGVRQGGLLFGPNQGNFIKLVAIAKFSAANAPAVIQFSQEVDGAHTAVGLPLDLPASATIAALELRLSADPETGVVEAAYRVNNGAFVTLPDRITLSGGTKGRFFDRAARGCLTATHKNSPAPINVVYDRFAVEPAASTLAPRTLVGDSRYNIGAGTITVNGKTWKGDAGTFTPDMPNEGGAYDIAETADDQVYQSYRGKVTNPAQNQRVATWEFPLPPNAPSQLSLRLHFAELFWGRAGGGPAGTNRRLFDIFVEDKLVLPGFDIFGAAGGATTAVVVPIENITVTDGKLTLRANATIDQVSLSGVEIFDQPSDKPIVNAGPDQKVDPGASVTLAGTASGSNPPLTYQWQQKEGPAVTLNGATTANPSFVAPNAFSKLVFELTVFNGLGKSASDTVTVNVGDTPIDGLTIASNSPQAIGATINVTASTAAGDNVSYTWSSGNGQTASGPTAAFVYNQVGTYTVQVTATNNTSSASASASVVVLAEQPFTLRINAGGAALTTPDDKSWNADQNAQGGTQRSRPPDDEAPINGTENDELYQTDRSAATFAYNIPVPASDEYIVTLHFAEIYFTGEGAGFGPAGAGRRVFDVNLEGGPVELDEYDINKEVGPLTAAVKTFRLAVADGTLNIAFSRTIDNAKVSAIEVVRVVDAPPVANAGADQLVAMGAPVTLNGAGSSDAEGATLAYGWRQVAGTPVSLAGAATVAPSFTAPSQIGALTFQLVVTDSTGLASPPDTVVIMVSDAAIAGLSASSTSPTALGKPTSFTAGVGAGSNVSYAWSFGDGQVGSGASVAHTYPAAGTYTAVVTATNARGSLSTAVQVTVTNEPPVADAGSDRTVTKGTPVTLDGSASSDFDGHTPLSFSWQQIAGPAVALNGATTAAPSFSAPGQGSVLIFQLVVSDSTGLVSEPDSIIVIVEDPTAPVQAFNSSPTLLGQTTSFTATAQGNNLTYSWEFGDGQTGSGSTTAHTYAAEGTYIVTVTVTSGSTVIGTAVTGVTVNDRLPTANAGPDQEVAVGVGVTLDGSASTPSVPGGPLTFAWTQINGTPVQLVGASTATPSFTAPATADTLTFRLLVTDADGKKAFDQVTVVVREVGGALRNRVMIPLMMSGT